MSIIGRPNQSTSIGATGTLRDPTDTVIISPVVVIEIIGTRRVDGVLTDIHEVQFQWEQTIDGFELDDVEWSNNIIVSNLIGIVGSYSADVKFVSISTATQTATITVLANSVVGETEGPIADEVLSFEFASIIPPAFEINGADKVCVIADEIPIEDNQYLGIDRGGAFNGDMECVRVGDYIYSVIQIQKHLITMPDNDPLVDISKQAGAVLIRVDMTDCSQLVLKVYENITNAARSLVVDGTDLYFMEGSHYGYLGFTHFEDNAWKREVGGLFRIRNNSSIIEYLGKNWRSATATDNPQHGEIDDNEMEIVDYHYGNHGGSASPMLVDDDILHMITGYGNADGAFLIHGNELPFERVGNWNWIQYHNKINQRVSLLDTNDRTGYDIMRDIANITSSIIGFDNEQFFMFPRETKRAKIRNGTMSSDTYIAIKDQNRVDASFNTGYAFIDGEIIEYTDVLSGIVNGVKRGRNQTEADVHSVDDEIHFVDHILTLNQSTVEQPINTINLINDYRQLYNKIRVTYGENSFVEVQDDNSILENGEKRFEFEVPLDSHQGYWAKHIANQFLKRFKDVHQILDVMLKPSPYLKIGDVVLIIIPHRLHLMKTCQILDMNNDISRRLTDVKFVTI